MRRARLLPALLLVLAACAREVPWATEPIATVAGQAKAGKALLVDCRPRADWAKGHLPGSLTLPVPDLKDTGRVKLSEVYFGKPVFVYGARGADAQEAVVLLRQRGVDARPLPDGFEELADALGVRVDPPPPSAVGEGR